jgi:glutaredoxin 3
MIEKCSFQSLCFALFLQLVVFAKSWCPHCDKTKELLKKPDFENVSVKVFDLDQMPDGTPKGPALQFVLTEMTGQKSVPSVWVNGAFLGGNDATQEKYQKGELQSSLLAVQA